MSESIRLLIKQATLARRGERLSDARRMFADAVELGRKQNAQRELIEALKGLGQIERDSGNGDAALPLYEEAVALCRSEGDALLLAHTVRHLGDIHQDAGRLDPAETCYREALDLYRANSGTSELDLANALRPLGILHETQGKTAEAISLWTEARDLYAKVGVQAGVAEGTKRLKKLGA
jgi:tetratricopeptide (TPR) repeat protein